MVSIFEYLVFIIGGAVCLIWALAATIVHLFSKNK